MTIRLYESRRHDTSVVFDVVDVFDDWRKTRGPQPPARGRVEFEIVGRDGEAVEPAIELQTTRNPSGMFVWNSKARTRLTPESRAQLPLGQREGPWQLDLIKEGDFLVRTRADAYSDDVVPMTLPLAEIRKEIRLSPGPLYAFPAAVTLLRGTLLTEGGSPWPNARVTVAGAGTEVTTPRTDESGGWVVAFRGAPNATVDLTFDDGVHGPVTAAGVAVTEGVARSYVQTGARGRVVAPSGAPAVGALVTITLATESRSVSRRDGTWSVAFAPGVNPSGPVQVEVRFGAATLSRQIHLHPGQVVTIDDFRFT